MGDDGSTGIDRERREGLSLSIFFLVFYVLRVVSTMLSSFARTTSSRLPSLLARGMATGSASGGHISDELLQKLGSLSTQVRFLRLAEGVNI